MMRSRQPYVYYKNVNQSQRKHHRRESNAELNLIVVEHTVLALHNQICETHTIHTI